MLLRRHRRSAPSARKLFWHRDPVHSGTGPYLVRPISLLAQDPREKRDGWEDLFSRIAPIAHVLLVSLRFANDGKTAYQYSRVISSTIQKNQGDQLTKNRPPCEVTETCGVTRLLLLAFGLRFPMLAFGFNLLVLLLTGLRHLRSRGWSRDLRGWSGRWRRRLSEHAGECQ